MPTATDPAASTRVRLARGVARLARALRSPGLSGRVFVGTAAIVCAVLVAALAVATASARRVADAEARRGLEQAADLTAQLLAGRGRSLAGGARVFVQGPYFRALVAERRRDDILDQAFEAADQLEAAWVFITDERGVLLAKSDEPGASGDALGGVPLIAGALEGRQTTGFGTSRDSLLFQTVAVPIVVPGAAPVGTLTATRLLDAALARDVRAATGADVLFYTLDANGVRHLAAGSLDERVARATLASAARGDAVGDSAYLMQHAALATAGGDVVGGFVVLRARDALPSGIAGVRRSLLAAGLLGLLLALLAAWVAARRVTAPVRTLAEAARAAVRGDYAEAAQVAADVARDAPRHELASLAGALGTLLAELREQQVVVESLRPADARRDGAGIAEDAAPEPRVGAGRRAARPLLATRRLPRIGSVLAPGDTFAGRYAVQAELGRGGTGIVYRALDLLVSEPVALKIIRPELVVGDASARERLARELRMARRITHRNVVRTHDLAEHDGAPYITMEYVEAASLGAVLRARGTLDERATIAIARQLARALAAAHGEGVAHGDLKPENLLVRVDGLLKVTDFGVATLLRRDGPAGPRRDLAGAIVGTPEYLAPEVLLGASADARADLYAFGVVLDECLRGGPAQRTDTPTTFLMRKLDPAPIERTRGPGAAEPRALDDLIASLTDADPTRRPTSAVAVGTLLARM